jgi:hypothetical protein
MVRLFFLCSLAFAATIVPRAYSAETIIFIRVYESSGAGEDIHKHIKDIVSNFRLINGNLGFVARLPGTEIKDEPEMPTTPRDKNVKREASRWLRNGDTLQIDVLPEQQAAAKAQAEKHHWFLTAKYTDKGGEVILTKDVTKYSNWQFLDENLDLGAEVPQYHIKNINDLGKDAWLGMDSKGVRYKGHVEIRKPILLFDKKQYIGVERQVPN